MNVLLIVALCSNYISSYSSRYCRSAARGQRVTSIPWLERLTKPTIKVHLLQATRGDMQFLPMLLKLPVMLIGAPPNVEFQPPHSTSGSHTFH